MGYLGTAPLSGDYRKLDDISSGFDGSETAFTLQVGSANVTPPKETTVTISVGGILQEPVAAYTIDGSTITFTAAPATGADFFGVLLGDSMSIGTPANDTVTGAKIVDDAINSEHYAAGSIDNEHIADGTIALAKTALVAGTGITLATNTLNIDASQTQITTVGTIGTGTWQGDAIASAYIAADAITGAKIADDAIDSEHYTDGSIDTAHIANDQITNALMADDAIGVAQLSATGTASSSTFLRGDNSWTTVTIPKLDTPVISGTLAVNDSGTVSHTISNYSDDVSYTITPTNCTVGAVNSSGVFVVTHTSGSPSYTIQATTTSLGLDDSAVATKNLLINLSAPTLSSPANAATSTNVVYTITSTDSNDDKLILDIGSSNFTYQSVSVGSGSKVGNTVEVTGFTTNNPAVTIQFTATATYSITAKAVDTGGTYGDSDSSAADSFTATDFDPTSPYDYGDGTDGSVTSVTVVDTYVTNNPSSGQAEIVVNSATGFSVDDQVLLIQSRKSGLTSGTHEYLQISAIDSTTITFQTNLQNAYTDTTAQMVRIPEYSAVTLSSDFAVPAWNGSEGGIFIAKCSGTFALSAKINATGKGHRGGNAASGGSGTVNGNVGEGHQALGGQSNSANGSGGGAGRQNVPGSLAQQSGAGGGHAAQGTGGSTLAVGGGSWGGQDLTSHLGFGGGGGSGGYDYSSQGGHGGIGGGIIVIIAATLTLSGSGELEADGGGGTGNTLNNQGGGAGGSIYVKSGTFTTNNACNAAAGPSGTSAGGAGSVGRIHVQASTITGTTSPTAYTG